MDMAQGLSEGGLHHFWPTSVRFQMTSAWHRSETTFRSNRRATADAGSAAPKQLRKERAIYALRATYRYASKNVFVAFMANNYGTVKVTMYTL
jgi:hypothetical protein